jgi:hypothetical protein
MDSITIENQQEMPKEWRFTIMIGKKPNATQHKVILSKEYWQYLTNGQITPAELITRSFEFLLTREPKESILHSFNVSLISTYFPEYEQIISS